MTSYTFLASSKKIQLPDEFAADHDAQMLRPIITLPYLYSYVSDISNYDDFLLYVVKSMEVGDVLEVVSIHSINHIENSVAKIVRDPKPITINVGSLTYKNVHGEFRLDEKNWIDDLRHRTIVSDYGVTTIVKY